MAYWFYKGTTFFLKEQFSTYIRIWDNRNIHRRKHHTTIHRNLVYKHTDRSTHCSYYSTSPFHRIRILHMVYMKHSFNSHLWIQQWHSYYIFFNKRGKEKWRGGRKSTATNRNYCFDLYGKHICWKTKRID